MHPNPVGYSTQDIAGDTLTCAALQFSDVDAPDFANLGKVLSMNGVVAGAYETMETSAACIMFYNGFDYDMYYFIADAYDADGNEVTGWANAAGDLISNEDARALGAGFWMRIPSSVCGAGTLTEAGAVSLDNSISLEISGSEKGLLTLVGNPYPTATNFSKMNVTGLVAGAYETMESEAACIMFYNGFDYDMYYYISDAYDADGNEVTGWADAAGDLILDDVSNAGAGFWIRSFQPATITFAL